MSFVPTVQMKSSYGAFREVSVHGFLSGGRLQLHGYPRSGR